MSNPKRPLGSIAFGGFVGGAIAGLGAGFIDGLWSYGELNHFLPGFFARLRLLMFLATSYAAIGAGLGAVAATGCALLARGSRIGMILRRVSQRHHRARERDPGQAVFGLSLAIAAIPVTGCTLWLTFVILEPALLGRKHFGLVVAAVMAATVIAMLVAGLLTFVVARPLELVLCWLVGKRQGLARALSSPQAPGIAGASAGLAVAGGLAALAWDTLVLLPLRPLLILLLLFVLSIPGYRQGTRLAVRFAGARALHRRLAIVAAVVIWPLLVVALGSSDAVGKAALRYSGLGGATGRLFRTLVDLDRDGYSPLLGGGDCNDWDSAIHPGAREIPDDGIDQNCIGGDPSAHRRRPVPRFAAIPPSVPSDFNVLLLTIDTVRSDHFSAYGYHRPTTPHIDALAGNGTLFENAWAHAPSTRYSIPAIITGRYPLDVHYDYSVRGWPGLSEENRTIAEILKDKGFATGAILNYWYFDKRRRLGQGIDDYDNENRVLHKGVAGEGPAQTTGSSSRQQSDKALAYIERKAKAGQRFFLWVHYYDPHYAYEAHSEVRSFGSGKKDLYDNEILFTDHHIGRLINGLRQNGLYEKTVVVITGDHGEGFGEHGIDLHGYHLYAAQTKVPLIVRVPGIAPSRVKTPVSHVDILPTLANLVGDEPSRDMMGDSLLGMIAGDQPRDADRIIFQQLSYENNNEMRAAASIRCHVIYNVSPQSSWEAYRIDIDPLESKDIIANPGPCETVRIELASWYDNSTIPEGAARALLQEPPALSTDSMQIEFGDRIRLVGVSVPSNPVRAGTGFDVEYTYQALADGLDPGWKVFAHFEAKSRGRFLGDHEPPRPFHWWRRGQFIRYRAKVHIPKNAPPGRYQLWMGVFRGNARLPARNRGPAGMQIVDNRADVATVDVIP